MPVVNLIQLRRGTAAQWTSTNPTLSAGETGFETDTGKFKLGNGSQTWTALKYAGGGGIEVSETAPASPDQGALWFNSADGQAYIYYDSFWIDLNPGIAGPAGKFTVSETAPVGAVSGDGWFNSGTARLFIRYDGFWVEATSNYIGPAGPAGPAGSAANTDELYAITLMGAI